MKYLLLSIFAICFVNVTAVANASQIQENLTKLEREFNGKIGIYAIDTNNNKIIAYRSDERFPLQSTIKLIGAAALFKQSSHDKALLQKTIHYTKNDLIVWHPITGKYVDTGMTLEALAEAATTYSDNPALNLVMKNLGGPKAVTTFARSIGNESFNLSHYEGALNSNPNVAQDTATPKDMAISVQKLTLGNVLTSSQRTQLISWMKNNTTGYNRIRAGVPIGWVVADKTGSGVYGIANDIGIIWSPLCKPIVLAIYTVQNKREAKSRDDVVAAITRLILEEFAKNNSSFKALFS